MNSVGEGNRGAKAPAWTPFTFWKWTLLFLIPYGLGHAILVVLVGLTLGLRIRSLLLPYVLLLWSGFVGASLIYWARQCYERPRSGAARFTIAIFFLLNLYMGVLVFSAYRVGLLTPEAALDGYGPYILPTAVIASVGVYFTARRRLEFIKSVQ